MLLLIAESYFTHLSVLQLEWRMCVLSPPLESAMFWLVWRFYCSLSVAGHQSLHDSAVTRESCRRSLLACKVRCFLRPFSFPVLTSLYWKMRRLAWKPSLDIKLSFVGPLLGPDDSTDQSRACLALVLVEVHTCLQIQENKVVEMSELCLTVNFSQGESKCNPMPCLKNDIRLLLCCDRD